MKDLVVSRADTNAKAILGMKLWPTDSFQGTRWPQLDRLAELLAMIPSSLPLFPFDGAAPGKRACRFETTAL